MEELSSREKNYVVNKTVGALLFAVFGAMGVFYFIWKENWNTAVWCLFLEIACSVTMRFTKPYLKTELHLTYSSTFFRAMKYYSIVLTVCSWCAFLTYIILGAIWKEVFDVHSHYAAAPVAFVAGFWYLVLFFDTRKYETLLE